MVKFGQRKVRRPKVPPFHVYHLLESKATNEPPHKSMSSLSMKHKPILQSQIHRAEVKTLTISPDLGSGPCHLGIVCAWSMYAALVPVPSITAAIASLSAYFAAANVPTVSLTCHVAFYISVSTSKGQLRHEWCAVNFNILFAKRIHNPIKGLMDQMNLTNAVTFISSPWRLIALFNSATTSLPTWLQCNTREISYL